MLSEDKDIRRLKEAIIDLYLAIKIRSTEEVRPFNITFLILIPILTVPSFL